VPENVASLLRKTYQEGEESGMLLLLIGTFIAKERLKAITDSKWETALPLRPAASVDQCLKFLL
jgi:hypothetical protein